PDATTIPPEGGTFDGTTTGTSMLAGTCGPSNAAPEHVFSWTPALSGAARIETCGAGTNYDTILYIRQNTCADGAAEVCNDDACANSTGAALASRIDPPVTAGQTYFIVVDGFGGDHGNFRLAVFAPTTTTTTTLAPTTT